MHNTSRYLEQYEDAVAQFYKRLRYHKFPVAKVLLRYEDNPVQEKFLMEPMDGDYTYEVEFAYEAHKDDDEMVHLEFHLYSEFLFSKDQYVELTVTIDGVVFEAGDFPRLVTLLKTKGHTSADIYKLAETIRRERAEAGQIP